MELQKSDIGTIENIIYKSGIPYEGIKIELIDHLASEVEMKMDANPKLAFEDALARVGYNMKETIIHIKGAMTKRTIKDMIINSFDFSNWMTLSVVLFFGMVSYLTLLSNGVTYAPIGPSFLIISIMACIVMKFRLRKVDIGNNYKLKVQKDFAAIPLLAVASICFAVALFFQITIRATSFHSEILNHMFIVPIGFAYGFFIKAVLDVTVLNVRKLKEDTELDELFEVFRPETFELT